MDTSFWTDLNPTPKFVNTTKLFYNQYLYKIELKLEGLNHYIRWSNRYSDRLTNLSNDFSQRYFDRHSVRVNLKLINFFSKFLVETKIKKRIEWQYLSLYTNDINVFQPIIDFLIKENACEVIRYVHLPGNLNLENAIKSGKIYVKRIPEKFKYKIKLKPNYDTETRHNLSNYLESIPDEIFISKKFMTSLTGRSYGYPGHFYCKDQNTFLCVKLIAPNIVDGIFELVRD